ncbi:thiol reductant ABC exporter subunit CydC [Nakamurella silvestris]|nr:thiol reductant ABC exporter subunit CydC [Nakamurella silvestris]
MTTAVPQVTNRQALRELLSIVRPIRGRLLAAAVLGALATACGVGLLALSAWLIARAAQQPPVLTLMVAVVGVRTFGISRGLLRYLERLISHDAALRVLAELRSRMVDRLAAIAPAGLPVWRRGELLARTVGDVDEVQDLLLRVILPLSGAALVATGSVAGLAIIQPAAALALALCLVVCCLLVPGLQARRMAAAEEEDLTLRAERTAELFQTFDGISDWAALGALDDRLDRLRALEVRTSRSTRLRARSVALVSGTGVLALGFGVLLALLLGIPGVTSGEIGPVWLAVLALTPLALAEMVTGVGAAAAALPRSLAAARRVVTVLHTPDPAGPEPVDPEPLPSRAPVIRLSGVSARWPGAAADTITGVDLELRPGKRIVLLGESGSGKSTLLAVLLGFLRPTAGSMTVDGVPVERIDRQEWTSLFGWTGDPAQILATTVGENLRFARPGCTDAELTAVLDRVGLGAWLAERGLDCPLGEHGVAVSGGEQQRIALARALLADRPVLLADEPVAHVDPVIADRLVTDLMAGGAERCTVLVTHRRQDAGLGDEVLEMSAGRVVRQTVAEVRV